ncbi:unnamed protein product [Closterium sp. NIES-54]
MLLLLHWLYDMAPDFYQMPPSELNFGDPKQWHRAFLFWSLKRGNTKRVSGVARKAVLATAGFTGDDGDYHIPRPTPSAPCPTVTAATATAATAATTATATAATATATATASTAILRAAQLELRFGFSRLIMRADWFSLTRG